MGAFALVCYWGWQFVHWTATERSTPGVIVTLLWILLLAVGLGVLAPLVALGKRIVAYRMLLVGWWAHVAFALLSRPEDRGVLGAVAFFSVVVTFLHLEWASSGKPPIALDASGQPAVGRGRS